MIADRPLRSRRLRPVHALILLLLLYYWAVSLPNLAVVPLVYEDEPWQASTGHKLATEGVFGSDMFAGFYNMDRRYYGYLPLHPLLLGVFFRFFGLGLFQARLETVTLGLLTLSLTYALGYRLFKSRPVAFLSVLFLLSARLNGVTPSQPTGILLLDIPRIARYDMVVPVFGLAALHAFLTARGARSRHWYFLSGLLAGLAGLGHLYGVFWLPALLALAIWDAVSRWFDAGRPPIPQSLRDLAQPPFFILLGFALSWLPYLVYVITDLPDFRGQGRIYTEEERFSLLSPSWYLENLLREPRRYAPGIEGSFTGLLRPTLWATLIALPLSLAVLFWRALRRGDAAARTLVVPAAIIGVLFALLVRLKLANYLVTLAPLAAVVVAWGAVQLWSALPPRARWAKVGLAVVVLLSVVEGSTRAVAMHRTAATTTPYDEYIARVHQFVPPGTRVLGLHNYWLGLDDTDYRALWVPLRWTDPNLVPEPLPFDAALEQIEPEYVLLDPKLRAYFEAVASPHVPGHELRVGFERWMTRRNARLIGSVEDPTYNRMDIYQVAP